MNKKSFLLSSSGLKNVIFQSFSNDEQFTFIFGDKEIQMNRFLAEFISPLVSHIHQTDPTIDRIQLIPQNDKSQKQGHIFTSNLYEIFQKIAQGYKIEVDKEMSNELRHLSFYLNNEELYSEMNSLFPIEFKEDQIDQYLKYINNFDNDEKEIHINRKFSRESIIDFISSHFYLIEKTQLLRINKRTLYFIICNEHLKLKDEDSLYEVIDELYSKEEQEEEQKEFPTKIDFYERILISELSDEQKKRFISNIESDLISSQLWMNVRDFLLNKLDNVTNKTNNEQRYFRSQENQNQNSIEVRYSNNSNEQFKGIISKLGNGNAKDALNNGVIDITCSSVVDNSDITQAKNVVDSKKVFESKSEPNSWLCINFIKSKVKPSHYSIRASDYGTNNCSLLNWCIEGSNDDKTWKPLDTRSNEQSLRESGSSNTFKIQTTLNSDEYFQYLRIRNTGTNTSGTSKLFFSAIEFFGSIHS